MENAPKLAVPEAIKFVIAETVMVPNMPRETWAKGQHKDAIIALIGGHGISKTAVIKASAARTGLDFCRLEFAGTESEDNLPIATQQEDPDKPGQYRKLAYGKLYQRPQGKLGRGICLISEGLGADRKQQQQMRAFISERELAGVPIADGWTFCLDSNFGNVYTDIQQITRSLEARMFFIPVQGSFEYSMKHWQGYNTLDAIQYPANGIGAEVEVTPGGMYGPLYNFLRMWGNDDKHNAFMGADPRRWTEIGDSLARQQASGFISKEESLQFFGLMVGDKLAGLYAQMLEWGDDPRYFPIAAHKLVKATKEEHAKHMELIKYWRDARNDKTFLIACTIMELSGYVENIYRDNATKMKPAEVANLVDLVRNVESYQAQLLIMAANRDIQNAIFDAIKDLPMANEIASFVRKRSEAARASASKSK
jgi:hypothetical protein